MQNLADGISRINKVLMADKFINPESIVNIMKSDLLNVASSYLEFDKNNAMVALEINQDGNYDFMLRINAKRLKNIGILPQN